MKIRADLLASAYIRHNCNGVRALRSMGHPGTSEVLRTTAWRLLTNVDVQKALAKLRKEAAMDALEAVARMADIARGSLQDFLDKDGRVNLAKARRLGKLHLIREYRVRRNVAPTIRAGPRSPSSSST